MEYEPLSVPLKDYEKYVSRREYWDDFAHEWKNSPIEQKIIKLAGFVQQGGNLKKAINHYAKNHDEMYRERIQHCILYYLLKLMTGDRVNASSDEPFVKRFKRFDKDELVKILTEQLKTSVRKCVIGTGWEIEYNNSLTPDEILDKFDRMHSRKYPEESNYTWWHRPEYWWDGIHSLW